MSEPAERRWVADTKSVKNSHLVVFILLAPCGPWRCWKHGKQRKDQSRLISIGTELERQRCIVGPTPELQWERLVVSSLFHCAFVFPPGLPHSGSNASPRLHKGIMGKNYFDQGGEDSDIVRRRLDVQRWCSWRNGREGGNEDSLSYSHWIHSRQFNLLIQSGKNPTDQQCSLKRYISINLQQLCRKC